MNKNRNRKFVKRNDIAIIAVVIIACFIAILVMNKKSTNKLVAQISHNNKIIKEIDLSTASDTIFKLSDNDNVSFQILNHKIRFVNTNCPDKLCENFGYLDKANDLAICLPNQVSLKLIGDKEEIDILVN
ncbi:MAG: NusG domain II-containing protein [Oscillospiraceae bacterium]